MQRFLIKLLLLALVTAGIYHLAGSYIAAKWYYADFIWLPCFIAVVTALLHLGLMRRTGDSKQFIRYYMGATGAKLLLYLIIILVVALIDKANAIPFALCFFFFYLSFTIFEVAESYDSFGANSGKKPEDLPAP